MDWVRDLPFLYRLKRYYSAQLTETSTPAVQSMGLRGGGLSFKNPPVWPVDASNAMVFVTRNTVGNRKARLDGCGYPDSAAVDLTDLLRTP